MLQLIGYNRCFLMNVYTSKLIIEYISNEFVSTTDVLTF